MPVDDRQNGESARPSSYGRMALAFVLLSLSALVVVPVLVQRQVDSVRSTVEEVASPARALVTGIRFSLSREMSSLRGFLLTGDENFLEVYGTARDAELAAYAELEPLARRLGPAAAEGFAEARALARQWHEVVADDSTALTRARSRNLAAMSTEQALFERALQASTDLEVAIGRAVDERRAHIKRIERFGLALSVFLAILALAAAGALGWLDMHVRQLAADAQRRREEAEGALAESARSNETRARLIRGITHDVKNPLGAANGYLELLEMQIKGPLTQGQVSLVSGARRSVDGALAIIGDLLDMAGVKGGGITIEPAEVDLRPVVAGAVEDHRASAQAAGLDMVYQGAAGRLELHTDAARVTQVLGNLLSNAVKYTPAPGRIEVQVEARDDGPGSGRWAAVHVLDRGPGIPEAERQAIFAEFSRLETGKEIEGHGLGLAIARRIARMLGGEITVSNRPEGGSDFTLWIPIRPPGAEPRA